MKKNNYLIIGIAIAIVIIAIVIIALFAQKMIPDRTIANGNDSNIVISPPAINLSVEIKDDGVINESVITNMSGNFKINLKTKNPQYKEGNNVFFIYEIQNLENETLDIPKNVDYGIEIKPSIGTPTESYSSSDKLIILKEDLSILPLQKITSEFSINSIDFELTGLNPVEGSYYAVNIYIRNVKSNKAMVRILK